MFFLPALKWVASPNKSSRNGQKIDLIVVHDCEGSYAGSVNWFSQTRSQVSAHLVLREDGAEATQMVEFGNNAWHACSFNRRSIGLEMGGFEAKGFGSAEWQAAANIVAWLLKRYSIPLRWAEKGIGAGFCSHYDLGPAGGGHHDPTMDPKVWQSFVTLVDAAYVQPMPDAWIISSKFPPPPPPSDFKPSGDNRSDEPEGSLSWVQARLNALGVAKPVLAIDGMEGPMTEHAIATFQASHGLHVDGIAGPQTIKALA